MAEPSAMANWITATIRPPPASALCGMTSANQLHQPTGAAVAIRPHKPTGTTTAATHAPKGINATAMTAIRPRHEADSQFFAGPAARRCAPRSGVGKADGARAGLRAAEVQHLALLDEILEGAGRVLDRHGQVNAVLVVQVDAVALQALERLRDHAANALRAAVQAIRDVDLEAELGGDGDVVADQGLGDEFLVHVGP